MPSWGLGGAWERNWKGPFLMTLSPKFAFGSVGSGDG